MGPDIHKTLRQLTDTNDDQALSAFYYRIKVQELLFLSFEKMLKRETGRHNRINRAVSTSYF